VSGSTTQPESRAEAAAGPRGPLRADLDQVALAVQSSPGVFALLLGSGVSTAAGIPTGNQILEDLIVRCAVASGSTEPSDARAWYQERFGEAPTYSAVLSRLGVTPAARRDVLRAYFEPTQEERERGLKAPSVAHRAIARLVASGHVRVIVTTNFDRLMEAAVVAHGVAPSVIASTDAVRGAMPLAHARCTIIKVHGDYLDARIRNTGDELERYPAAIARLLRQVFDEYGLIVCGWSAEWDPALRRVLGAGPERRFPLYWGLRRDPTPITGELIEQRGGRQVRMRDADTLFEELAERVAALDERRVVADLSVGIVRERVKRYVVDPVEVVRLSDLVGHMLVSTLPTLRGLLPDPIADDVATPAVLERVESAVAPLLVTMVHGCHWGGPEHLGIWWRVLQSLASLREDRGRPELLALRLYPAQLALYAGGIAALVAGRHRTVASLLLAPIRDRTGLGPACDRLTTEAGIDPGLATRLLPEAVRPGASAAPVSEHLSGVLREEFVPYLPSSDIWEDVFDRFEYLLGLAASDVQLRSDRPVSPSNGRYAWRSWDHSREAIPAEAVPWVDAGLFPSVSALRTAIEAVAHRRSERMARMDLTQADATAEAPIHQGGSRDDRPT
jgi:hypothetical protein